MWYWEIESVGLPECSAVCWKAKKKEREREREREKERILTMYRNEEKSE